MRRTGLLGGKLITNLNSVDTVREAIAKRCEGLFTFYHPYTICVIFLNESLFDIFGFRDFIKREVPFKFDELLGRQEV